jgi:hypothetical protein
LHPPTSSHDPIDLDGVVDIGEGIRIEDHEIGNLSCLD